MIKSFSHKGLENLYYDGTRKGVNPQHADKLERILDRLQAAAEIDDMDYPGSKLHLLNPKQEGRWSVRVSENWRVTFIFKNGDAYEVDYQDYH